METTAFTNFGRARTGFGWPFASFVQPWIREEATMGGIVADNKQEFTQGIRGKVVEAITIHDEADGVNRIDISFRDRTTFHIRLDSRMVLEAAELQDWKGEEGVLVEKFL
jgi:hypothetical protein